MAPSKTYPAKELKNKIGSVLASANREPIAITRNGHFSYVIISAEDWENIRGEQLYSQRNTPKKTEKKKSWGDFEATGMWADREDMKDPVAYVQNLRKPRYTV